MPRRDKAGLGRPEPLANVGIGSTNVGPGSYHSGTLQINGRNRRENSVGRIESSLRDALFAKGKNNILDLNSAIY